MIRLVIATSALIVLFVTAPAGAVTIQSGFFEIDSSTLAGPVQSDPIPVLSNILVNPGFETGSLLPWTTNNWSVTSGDAHTGTYSAEDVGNYWVRQDFVPIPVGDINSISMWSKQPVGIAFQAVDFFYSATDYDEFLVAPGVDWTFIDMTSELRGAGSLFGIRIWGYSSGTPDDLTRIDDVIVDAVGATAVEPATWGRVKDSFR